jgi:hypothetical protein
MFCFQDLAAHDAVGSSSIVDVITLFLSVGAWNLVVPFRFAGTKTFPGEEILLGLANELTHQEKVTVLGNTAGLEKRKFVPSSEFEVFPEPARLAFEVSGDAPTHQPSSCNVWVQDDCMTQGGGPGGPTREMPILQVTFSARSASMRCAASCTAW